jgi:hypothetical protein
VKSSAYFQIQFIPLHQGKRFLSTSETYLLLLIPVILPVHFVGKNKIFLILKDVE